MHQRIETDFIRFKPQVKLQISFCFGRVEPDKSLSKPALNAICAIVVWQSMHLK